MTPASVTGSDARPPHRGDVVLVALDPTVGREIRKARPCLVVSPDELNRHVSTLVVAPMTTGGRAYPFRVPCRFQKRRGFVVLDQIRTIDRARAVRRLGRPFGPDVATCTVGAPGDVPGVAGLTIRVRRSVTRETRRDFASMAASAAPRRPPFPHPTPAP